MLLNEVFCFVLFGFFTIKRR